MKQLRHINDLGSFLAPCLMLLNDRLVLRWVATITITADAAAAAVSGPAAQLLMVSLNDSFLLRFS